MKIYKTYADSIGKTVDQLTDAEKQRAFTAEQGRKKLKVNINDKSIEFMTHTFGSNDIQHNIANARALHQVCHSQTPKMIAVNPTQFQAACRFLVMSQIAVLELEAVPGCEVWTVI